ncbi:MAG: hypothetical protein D6692_07195 [Planctomycetota bacterium]|nr:MAG: hypothetical protein D6692_07195 [Planctomycetota bacterium]
MALGGLEEQSVAGQQGDTGVAHGDEVIGERSGGLRIVQEAVNINHPGFNEHNRTGHASVVLGLRDRKGKVVIGQALGVVTVLTSDLGEHAAGIDEVVVAGLAGVKGLEGDAGGVILAIAVKYMASDVQTVDNLLGGKIGPGYALITHRDRQRYSIFGGIEDSEKLAGVLPLLSGGSGSGYL